jgi:hypothetical protein
MLIFVTNKLFARSPAEITNNERRMRYRKYLWRGFKAGYLIKSLIAV